MMPQNILQFLSMQQQPQDMLQPGMQGMSPAMAPQDNGMVQQILSARFEPTADDVGNSALAGISANKYVNPQDYADNRMQNAMKQMQVAAEMQKLGRGSDFDQLVNTYQTLPEGDPRKKLYGDRLTKETTGPLQLKEVYDANSPTGTRYVNEAEAAGQWGAPKKGQKISVGADGSVEIFEGTDLNLGGGGGLTKATTSKIQDKLFDSSEQMARLKSIKDTYKPSYQQLGTRIGMKGSELKDFVGKPLNPQEQADLIDFTQFRQNSAANLNATIKDITGQAMSAQEAGRISQQVPNAGQGIFDGDAPTPFKAKLDNASQLTSNAIIRYNWALSNGLNPLQTGIELQAVPALIDREGAKIEAKVRSEYPGATQEQIDMETRTRLGKLFGM